MGHELGLHLSPNPSCGLTRLSIVPERLHPFGPSTHLDYSILLIPFVADDGGDAGAGIRSLGLLG